MRLLAARRYASDDILITTAEKDRRGGGTYCYLTDVQDSCHEFRRSEWGCCWRGGPGWGMPVNEAAYEETVSDGLRTESR